MKKIFTLILLFALSLSSLPDFASAGPNLLKGGNADFDYVYMDEDITRDFSSAAADMDKNPVEVFPDDDGDKQYLYLGSKSPFDRATFTIIKRAKYQDTNNLIWEYYEDGDWEELYASDSYIDGFTDKGTYYASWNMPKDWDKKSYNGKSAYWIRIRPEGEVDKAALVEQISARTYNLEIIVEDDRGDDVDDLTKNDFDVSGGSNNTIYGFLNRGNGIYWLALNAEANDTSYKLSVKDSRFQEEKITISSLNTSQDSYNIRLESEDNGNVYLSSNGDMPFIDLDDFEWAENAIEDLYERGVVEGKSYYYYYPADSITRAEFLKIILLSADIDVQDYDNESENFRDVSSYDWYYPYIQAGLALRMIDDDYYFYPDVEINRAEAVTMLVRLQDKFQGANLDKTDTPFWDVSPYDWFAKYIAYAYDERIIEGYEDRSFRPINDLNRAEAAVLADNAYHEWWR